MNYPLPETPEKLELDLKPPTFKGLRLSEKTVSALEAMAYEGLSLHIAADRAGVRRHNLQRAFEAPMVKQAYNRIVDFIRSNAAQDAYLRMVDLAQNAQSENVKLRANEWVAGVDGISPLKKVQGQHNHSIQFGGFIIDAEERDTDTESTVIDGESAAVAEECLIIDG